MPDAGVRPDAGVDAGLPPVDAGPLDGGFDAGPTDAGLTDGGLDAGADGGPPDAGATDAGPPIRCAGLACQPWEQCLETGGAGRCVNAVTISWLSPVAGASAPLDLTSIPLAITTTAANTLDVPWTSGGVLVSAGTFSGERGVRAATLFINAADAGVVTLTAGWDGGPNATTQFVLASPIVQHLGPRVPSYGTSSPEFEPNDPAGPAWRRDDVVPFQIADLPQPIALHARFDGPGARTWSAPVTARCDAGSCWRADVALAELHFPAFRGAVLFWASGADGGLQTRPTPFPVTRWRWRRQVSGVPNPIAIAIARPITSNGTVLVGSADTTTTGRLLRLDGSGQLATAQPVGWTQAVTTLSGSFATAVGAFGPDGGAFVSLGSMQPPISTSSTFVASGGAADWTAAMTERGQFAVFERLGTRFSVPCPNDAGVPFVAFASSSSFIAGVSAGGPLCVVPTQPPLGIQQPLGTYRPPLIKVGAHQNLDLLVGGETGGLWSILRVSGTISETLLLDAGVVDGVVLTTPATGAARMYWVGDDLRVNAAPLNVSPLTSPPMTRTLGAISTAPVPLARRARGSPVAVPAGPGLGSLYVVDGSGELSSRALQSLALEWRLEAGDGGIRGGTVDRDPIFINACTGLGSLLIPSTGDGALYSVVGDIQSLDPVERWPMGGATSSNTHEFVARPDVCVSP